MLGRVGDGSAIASPRGLGTQECPDRIRCGSPASTGCRSRARGIALARVLLASMVDSGSLQHSAPCLDDGVRRSHAGDARCGSNVISTCRFHREETSLTASVLCSTASPGGSSLAGKSTPSRASPAPGVAAASARRDATVDLRRSAYGQ